MSAKKLAKSTAPKKPADTLAQIVVKSMLAKGFTDAQVFDTETILTEVNIDNNVPSLLRSTVARKLSLQGLQFDVVSGQNRKVSGECSDLSEAGIEQAIEGLLATSGSAPLSDAYAVSSAQKANFSQGPLKPDMKAMTQAAASLLAWRAKKVPMVKIGGGTTFHKLEQRSIASSQGTHILARLGYYGASVFANASDATRSSSFNMADGACHQLNTKALFSQFSIAEVLSALPQQMDTTRLTENFSGDVILSTQAVQDLISWLIGQLSDGALLAGTSTLMKSLNESIASPLFTLKSRFDAPSVLALSAEGFLCKPITVVKNGVLKTLLPSDYASRKLGIQRVMIPASPGMFGQPHGWEIAAGKQSSKAMVQSVKQGALVGRLSMGAPASNGDFSGVIKNSFLIENGKVQQSLSETMVSGNMRQMLKNIIGVSKERVDSGAFLLPKLHINGLNFS
jgi:PmbA protein